MKEWIGDARTMGREATGWNAAKASVGHTVRLVSELMAEDGTLLPGGARGTVIGFQGERVVVSFEGGRSVVTDPWNCRVQVPRVVR